MDTALDRIRQRVEGRTLTAAVGDTPTPPAAQAPTNPPPPPANTPEGDAQRLDDLEATVTDLGARLDALEQAQIDQALTEMDSWSDPDMMAALDAGFGAAAPNIVAETPDGTVEQRPDGFYVVPTGDLPETGPLATQAEAEQLLASLSQGAATPVGSGPPFG